MSKKNEQKKIMEDLKLNESEAKKKAKEEELKKKVEKIENDAKLRVEELKKKVEEIENEAKLRVEELKMKAEEIENEEKLKAEEFQKKIEEIPEISNQFEGLDESEPGKIEDLKTSESNDSHRVLSEDYSESHSEELGDDFTFDVKSPLN
jgi:hypothetical protein